MIYMGGTAEGEDCLLLEAAAGEMILGREGIVGVVGELISP